MGEGLQEYKAGMGVYRGWDGVGRGGIVGCSQGHQYNFNS